MTSGDISSQLTAKVSNTEATAQNPATKPEAMRSKCNRCGLSPSHNRHACPAKGAECRKCAKKGHYAIMCHSKKVVCRMEEAEDDIILGSIVDDTATVNNLKQGLLHADVDINGQHIKFRVDTGADVSVAPVLFQETLLGNQSLQQKVVWSSKNRDHRCWTVPSNADNRESQNSTRSVPHEKEPLLGRPAIEALHLLERVNNMVSPSDSGIIKEFPELFTGLGKLKMTYRITM